MRSLPDQREDNTTSGADRDSAAAASAEGANNPQTDGEPKQPAKKINANVAAATHGDSQGQQGKDQKHTAAVTEGHQRSTQGPVDHTVEKNPSSNRITTIRHDLTPPVRPNNQTPAQAVTTDHKKSLDKTNLHDRRKKQPGPSAETLPKPPKTRPNACKIHTPPPNAQQREKGPLHPENLLKPGISQEEQQRSPRQTNQTKQPKAPTEHSKEIAKDETRQRKRKERPDLPRPDTEQAPAVEHPTAHRLQTNHHLNQTGQQNPNTRGEQPRTHLSPSTQPRHPKETRQRGQRTNREQLSEHHSKTDSPTILQAQQLREHDASEAHTPHRPATTLSPRMPDHRNPGGKLLLAQLPEDKLLETYPSEELVQANAKSIATRDELQVHLRKTAKRGYATNFGEGEPGISGVAVLVESKSRPSYALAVAAPSERLAQGRVKELVSELQATASALSDLS
ncbi:transcriptional regulator [Arthrobacter sp. cf158]|nr:transcriptional regulator [Arthrobacter sp. cf158]